MPKPGQSEKATVVGCLGCATLLAGIVLAIVIAAVFVTNTPKSEEDALKAEAWAMAQVFVKRKLKTPGSASFTAPGERQRPEDTVSVLGNNRFRVSGWVDAENGFGALIRTRFVCVLERSADGETWKLLDSSFVSR